MYDELENKIRQSRPEGSLSDSDYHAMRQRMQRHINQQQNNQEPERPSRSRFPLWATGLAGITILLIASAFLLQSRPVAVDNLTATRILAQSAEVELPFETDFSEESMDGWGFNQVTADLDQKGLCVIPDANSSLRDADMYALLGELDSSKEYVLQFVVWSDRPTTIEPFVGQVATPWQQAWWSALPVSSQKQLISLPIIAKDLSKMAFALNVGGQSEPTQICLDHLKLYESTENHGMEGHTLLNSSMDAGFASWGNDRADIINGRICFSATEDQTNRWDRGAYISQLRVAYDKTKLYRLTYDAEWMNPSEEAIDVLIAMSDVDTLPEKGVQLFQVRQPISAVNRTYTVEFTPLLTVGQPVYPAVSGADIFFGVGGQGNVDVCFDNIVLEVIGDAPIQSAVETPEFLGIQPNEFINGLAEWDSEENNFQIEQGTACINADEDSSNPWDILLAQNLLPYVEGNSYQLSFNASADRDDAAVRVVAGMSDDPYPFFFDETAELSTESTPYQYEFTALFDTINNPNQGNISFQIGGQGAVTVCIEDVTLTQLSPE